MKKAEFTPHCLLECSACMIPLNNVHGELSRPTDCFIDGVDCTLEGHSSVVLHPSIRYIKGICCAMVSDAAKAGSVYRPPP